MAALALREAAKHGHVEELRQLLATASPGDVNAGDPKHGYRPLHYGAYRLLAKQQMEDPSPRHLTCLVCPEQLRGTG